MPSPHKKNLNTFSRFWSSKLCSVASSLLSHSWQKPPNNWPWYQPVLYHIELLLLLCWIWISFCNSICNTLLRILMYSKRTGAITKLNQTTSICCFFLFKKIKSKLFYLNNKLMFTFCNFFCIIKTFFINVQMRNLNLRIYVYFSLAVRAHWLQDDCQAVLMLAWAVICHPTLTEYILSNK